MALHFSKDEYYILILGLDNAGKTTLLEHIKRKFNEDYKGVAFEKITNTVGLNIGKIEVSGIKLLFWDLGGDNDLQSLWDKYYEECHGLIYVVDSVDQQRLHESAKVFSSVLQNENLQNVPLLVYFNKQDSQNAISVEDIKDSFKDVTPYIGRRDCTVLPVSAIEGDGVENGINWMVRCVKRNIYRPAHTKNRPPGRILLS
ncbi:ADP-ribosylation factor-related protein 1-like [Xenia sp. Carnegie-2017]|uniref:ADP-ribosylation factor-related protein 1-like n=1 Tax=Xenia sp. Carnegie-2017 TaxID=2897299 RepID=UPI001F03559D|nr:ADP-ribosylation factor-related protein 1-like [Xenia sp. Carnegie-2017]